MSQADGYVRIVTQNDTTEAQRSTEQLGDTIRDSLDTTPVNRTSDAMNEMRQGVDDTGTAAISTGQLIKAKETLIKSNSPRSNPHTHAAEFDTLRFNQRIPDLISDTIMQGIQLLGAAMKETAGQAVSMAMDNETASAKVTTLLKGDNIQQG